MRIIAGQFRGRNLKSPPTLDTRPTSDRLRETLFNILAPRIAGARFLDLCAGSGAVGIEALSRDAVHTTFVDSSRRMCQLINANLELCRVTNSDAAVITADAVTFLKRHCEKGSDAWDIVYYDPPYKDDYSSVLGLFADHPELLSSSGLLIVEHDHRKQLLGVQDDLQTLRTLKQGDSALSFYGHTKKPTS